RADRFYLQRSPILSTRLITEPTCRGTDPLAWSRWRGRHQHHSRQPLPPTTSPTHMITIYSWTTRLPTVAEGRGGWQTFGEATVYDSRWVRLGLVDVEAPNGERWDYHVVHLGRIAVALVVDDQDRALMMWRYRFITNQWGYEESGKNRGRQVTVGGS